MTLELSRSDYRFLQVLFKIDQALAIVPWYSFERSSLTHPLLNKFQSVVYSIAIMCWSLHSLLARQQFREAYYTTVTVSIDYFHDFGLLLLTVSTMVSSCLVNQNHWLKLNNSFQLVDKKLNTRNRKVGNFTRCLLTQIVLSHVVFMGPFAYTIYNMESSLRMFNIGYWADLVCWYYFFHVQLLAYNLAEALKCRYRHLNEFLGAGWNSLNVGSKVNCMRETAYLSRILSEIVDEFNTIFGLSHVCVVGLTVVQILMCLDYGILEPIDQFGISVSILCAVLAALILVSTSMVIMACDFAKKESQKTTALRYKLQEQLPADSLERKELLRLAKVASNNVARFTAAGFFELNRGTLCTILGTTTTYLIVMIQFTNNNNTK